MEFGFYGVLKFFETLLTLLMLLFRATTSYANGPVKNCISYLIWREFINEVKSHEIFNF